MSAPQIAEDAVRATGWWSIGEPRVLAGLETRDRLDLAAHQAIHGAAAKLTRSELEQACDQVALLGRGGAGFPVAVKLRSMPPRGRSAVIVNGSESEPASAKDRLLMRRAPHLVLDGLAVVGHALHSSDLSIAVHDQAAEQSLRAAIAERGESRRVRVVRTPGRFVSGEARAVIHGLEGKPALPSGRRILPTESGLNGRPTFLSNAETFAQIALMARLGRHYADTGVSEEPGTTLLTVGGAVARPGVVEVPIGVPLRIVLEAAGAAADSTILLGGYHGTFVDDPASVVLSRPHLKGTGLVLGAGVVAVLSPNTCALAEVEAVSGYLASQSAGQCGPCVFGLPAIANDLRRLRLGQADALDNLRRHAGIVTGRGACAHPDGLARLIGSFLTTFPDEVELHRRHGGCGKSYRAELPLATGGLR